MLDPSQKKAVEHYGKPLLLVAGAGSGKTRTLVHKIEHLISVRGLNPSRILVVTFTRKAANEIRERILKTVGASLEWVETFHSFGLKVIKQDHKLLGISKDFTLLEDDDRDNLLKKILRFKGSDEVSLERLKSYISKKREDLIEETDPLLEELYMEYEKLLISQNLLDFSSILYLTLKAFRENPRWRESFDFILVDEFQDTNTVQYEMLKSIAKDKICVVGDPNQCIYEWRYARPDNILRFVEDFRPDVIKLEYNYRSQAYIIRIANAILSASKAAWKDLVPVLKPTRSESHRPVVRRFLKEEEEAKWIAQEIKKLRAYYPYEQMAILVRVTYVTDYIEKALFQEGIPYRVVGAVKFFERAEIKDALSFLRFLANPKDSLSFERLLKVSRLKLTQRQMDLILGMSGNNLLEKSLMALKHLPQEKAIGLHNLLKTLSKHRGENYHQTLEAILQEVGFETYLEENYTNFTERLENIKELMRFLKERWERGTSLEDLLAEVDLLADVDDKGRGVSIMTVHSSKGLEFPVVFLPRLEEGIFPHEKALEDERQLEEERRLFYVAITRAKDMLYLTYTRGSNRKPSSFLSDIPKDLLDLSAFKRKTSYMPELRSVKTLKEGQLVKHKEFGLGRIISLQEEKARVDFGSFVKTIYLGFLEPVE